MNERAVGTAIIVDGKTVAWFAEFTPSADNWCKENHFGRWLGWRAKTPEIVPLTQTEYETLKADATRMAERFKHG